MTIKLYDFDLSGHAHRVRLFLSLIEVDAEIVQVDLANGEHKTPEFLAMNSLGQVPVLDDDGTYVSDSTAILVYLAKKFGRTDWLPEDPAGAAAVQRWLSIAAGEIAFGPAAARLITLFGAKHDADEVIGRAKHILRVLDETLEDREFLVGGGATIADVALYSYIANAPEGNVDLAPYERVRGWLSRIEALPRFVPFVQSEAGLRMRQ